MVCTIYPIDKYSGRGLIHYTEVIPRCGTENKSSISGEFSANAFDFFIDWLTDTRPNNLAVKLCTTAKQAVKRIAEEVRHEKSSDV